MRLVGVIGAAALAVLVTAGTGFAQSAPAGGGPAELPLASYSERTYVDSRGCIFIRAGSAGQVQWVPRVTRRMEPLCGAEPSLASAAATASPIVVAPNLTAQLPTDTAQTAQSTPVPLHVMTTMHGFEPAWQDGRLNPDRGPRSDAGDAAMAEVWTQTVPMVRQGSAKARQQAATARVAASRKDRKKSSGGSSLSGSLGISTKNAAVTAVARHWVQIGVFSVPGNAQRAAASIAANGFSARQVPGSTSTSVMAGPFASLDAAKAALVRMQSAGFADAYLRR